MRCVRIHAIGLAGYEASNINPSFPGKTSITLNPYFNFDLLAERSYHLNGQPFRNVSPIRLGVSETLEFLQL